jgi:hypothetical protein
MSSVPNKTALAALAATDEFYVVDKSDTTDGATGTGKKATLDTLLSAMPQSLKYTFSTTTTDADPGTATMRFDNATPASVTKIYIDDESSIAGLDLGTVYDDLASHRVLIVQANDSTKFLLGEVTADADNTGYWTLTVTTDDSGTLPDDAASVVMIVLPGPGSGGGSMPPEKWDFDAGQIIPDGTGGELDRDTGSNRNQYRNSFAISDVATLPGRWTPSDIDTTGTVTFRVAFYATTAAASKNIQLRYSHLARSNSESWDVAYTNEDSGNMASDATQDDLTILTWTETVSNLGWTANEYVVHQLSRIAAASDELTGDAGIVSFSVTIPRA